MTMDDAQAIHPGPSPDGHGEDETSNQILTMSTMHDTLNQVFSENAQSMLQQVAQDATSQIDENLSTQVPTSSQAGPDPNMAHQHSAPSGEDIDGQLSQDDRHLDASSVQANGAEPLLPDYHHLHKADSTNALDLAQVNEALLVDTDDPTLEAATSVIDSEAPRIQAFAKLEFDDGEFYMNTYSVELGRDIRAARQAYELDLQASANLRKQSSSSANLSHSSSKVREENGEHLAGGVISESGGVMALDPSDRDEDVKQRRHKKTKSTTSSSQQLSRKSSMNLPGTRTDYQSLAMASLRDPTVDEELAVPAHRNMPSPEACPIVPIHPPTATDGATTSHKSISRKHVRIAFNFEKHLFEVIVLGRNGAFVDEEWYPKGDVQSLRSGSLIQIGGVGIRFLLPDVAPGETGAENHRNSDPVSFDMDYASGGSGDIEGSSDAERDDDDEDDVNNGDAGDDSNDIESEEEEEQESDESKEEPRGRQRPRLMKPTPANRPVRNRKSVQGKKPTKTREPPKAKAKAKQKTKLVANSKEAPKPELVTPPPKRKGPGRPPKNGIISKREEALLAREAKEAAKAATQGKSKDMPASGRGKGKSLPMPIEAKPEKEKNNLQPNGKRKYKKRKTKAELEAGEQQGVRESTEHTDAVPPEQNAAPPPKPPKPMKPPKPPRSPSPVFDEATLTPEQLAKPQASYVVLIHEALSNSPTGQMSLPQIYRAIERKYPFYKLRVTTTGWQSSVRHNLSQHAAFRKIERDGKGWMWGLVPEISIEKEKKRRMTPPPMAAQGYYPGPQMIQPPYNSYPGMPGPIQYPYGPYTGSPVGPTLYHPPGHYPPPMSSSAPALPAALANAQVDNSSTYQSPYATASSQPKPESSQPQQHPPAPNGQQIPADTPIPAENGASLQQSSSQPQLLPPSLNRPPSQISHSPHLADHTPEFQNVIHKFKSYLLKSMADKPNAEAIIDSAINGVLNTPDQNQNNETSPASPSDDVDGDANGNGQRGNDLGEQAIQNILRAMLDNLRKKALAGSAGGGAASGPSHGASSTPTFTEILNGVGEGASVGTPAPAPAPAQPQPRTQSQTQDMTEQQQQQQRSEPETPRPDIQQAHAVVTDGMPEVERASEREEKPDKPDESTTLVRAMQTGKRPLEEDGGEDGGAMDARQMRAKRVAI
ncbi:MAG: hypothetical protein LQ350_001000 [Teloschistes chrysophthalmus]|nr:MAG: hypothetical protein LQ350_001000 [Niorma chrysophthalma]